MQFNRWVYSPLKSQIPSTKSWFDKLTTLSQVEGQMVRQAHHPEQSRRVNLKFQYPMTKTKTDVGPE
jgi:hypothetical protein